MDFWCSTKRCISSSVIRYRLPNHAAASFPIHLLNAPQILRIFIGQRGCRMTKSVIRSPLALQICLLEVEVHNPTYPTPGNTLTTGTITTSYKQRNALFVGVDLFTSVQVPSQNVCNVRTQVDDAIMILTTYQQRDDIPVHLHVLYIGPFNFYRSKPL